MSTSEKIARAYGVLLARGEKVTVRAVQREAGVRIGEVAAWMREHAGGAAGDVPAAPDLSEAMSAMVASVWAAAWKRAAEQADEATERRRSDCVVERIQRVIAGRLVVAAGHAGSFDG